MYSVVPGMIYLKTEGIRILQNARKESVIQRHISGNWDVWEHGCEKFRSHAVCAIRANSD